MEGSREEHIKTTCTYNRNKRRYTVNIATTKKFKPVKYVLSTLILLLLITFVSAGDLKLSVPRGEYNKVNESYTIRVQVHNSTSSIILAESVDMCIFELYAPLDNDLLLTGTLTDSSFDLIYVVAAGNFTQVGEYPIYITCNDAGEYGYETYTLNVNKAGEELTTALSFTYYAAMFLLFLFILGLVYIITRLPSEDNSDEENGEIISISWLKHLRVPLWVTVWWLVVAVSYIALNFTEVYLTYDLLGAVFLMIFRLMLAFSIVATPIYIVWLFYKMYTDGIKKGLLERGVKMSTL